MLYTLSQKQETHSMVHKAVTSGTLVRPKNCSECGKTGRIHAHHADYSKPLSVEWLCCKCHKKRHPVIHKHSGGRKALLRPCHISFDIDKSLLSAFRAFIKKEGYVNVPEALREYMRSIVKSVQPTSQGEN